MMQNLKYGILTGGGYIVAAAAIALLACIINSAAGEDNALFLSTPYYIFGGAGLLAAIACGVIYPTLLSQSMRKYSEEYPDLPKRYIREICRGKLLLRYYFNISWICFAIGLTLFHSIEKYPLIVCVLMGSGFTFLFLYIGSRKKYENL